MHETARFLETNFKCSFQAFTSFWHWLFKMDSRHAWILFWSLYKLKPPFLLLRSLRGGGGGGGGGGSGEGLISRRLLSSLVNRSTDDILNTTHRNSTRGDNLS